MRNERGQVDAVVGYKSGTLAICVCLSFNFAVFQRTVFPFPPRTDELLVISMTIGNAHQTVQCSSPRFEWEIEIEIIEMVREAEMVREKEMEMVRKMRRYRDI
jgi:hypothetical protein